jgi:uncharacterized protein involved in exopolysaccharide biosynthesis
VSDDISIRRHIEQPIPTIRELAMVLFRRRRIFLFISGIVFAAAVLYAMAGTRYEAHMQVLVRKGRADAPVSAGVNAPLDLTHLAVTEEEINSEVELLRDHEVLRQVVEKSPTRGRDWFRFLHAGEGRDQTVERSARGLAAAVKVEPVKKTNLISIRYAAADPQAAANVLRSLANVYLEKHMAVHRPKGELGFFEQQTAESRRQLEQASRRLLDFTQSHSVVSAAQQRDLALQKLGDLDAAERQTRIDLAEKRQRVHQLIALTASLPERTTTQVHTADNPELLRSLKAGLLDLQLKRTQLLTKFEPSHRLVKEVEQQISQTQAAIAIESATPVRDETTDKNVHYEWAAADLEQTKVQLQSLSARESATRLQLAACRSLAEKLGEDAIVQDDLLSSQKAAEENYLLYVKKREEARMNDALDERGIVNVAIAEQPVAPALPVRSVWMILAVGFIGAGTTGIAAAFVADYLDPAFRDPEDVLACLNAPVLASLPRIGRSKSAA